MIKQSQDQIVENIKKDFENSKVIIAAPVVKGRKGHYKELFLQIRKKRVFERESRRRNYGN